MIVPPPWRAASPVALAGLLLIGGAGPLAGQESEEARERWQRVPDVVGALGIGPGARVADIGAGGGFFTVRLARVVGTGGRVFAVDVDGDVVRQLEERAAREGWSNVEVVHSRPDDPRLPDGGLDAALIVNAYHEFSEADAMLRGLARALRPGGRLVIVDQAPRTARRTEPRAAQQRAHELGSWHAVRDLVVAGFRVTRLEDPFIEDQGTDARDDWWLVVAVRPE